MREFTYSEARQRLAFLLDSAAAEGAVRIRRRDGRIFVLRPDSREGSPLDVPSLELGLSRKELLDLIRESRRPA
jgi:hypothetical protein